jgi:hypothetical protein
MGNGSAVPVDCFRVALFWNVAGAAEATLIQIGPSILVDSLPGRFNGGIYTTPTGSPRSFAVFQVRAWSAQFETYDRAIPGRGYVGKSSLWTQVIGSADLPETDCRHHFPLGELRRIRCFWAIIRVARPMRPRAVRLATDWRDERDFRRATPHTHDRATVRHATGSSLNGPRWKEEQLRSRKFLLIKFARSRRTKRPPVPNVDPLIDLSQTGFEASARFARG